MKILKIFGLVVGIHVFALILIFANPGCSSTSKPSPAPMDTVGRTGGADGSASVSLPAAPRDTGSPMSIAFNPDAPATATPSSSGFGQHYTPTRPGSAAASTLVVPPVTDVTPATPYTVKAGDSLWELGKKFKIPYAEIAATNNLKANAALRPGQKLLIPGKAGAATLPATAGAPAATTSKAVMSAADKPAASANATAMKHTVKPGETLGGIARTYGVKQSEIALANNITDPQKIRPGMELVIPGWQGAPGSTRAKSGSNKSSSRTSAPASSPAASSSAPAAPAAKPVFNIIDPGTPPPQPNDAPVIKVDESPMTPAPKN